MFFRKTSAGSSTTLVRAVDYNGHLPESEIQEGTGALPNWKLTRYAFTYESDAMPTREEISTLTSALEEMYGMKLLYANVSLVRGQSWTDKNARFGIDVTLRRVK